ncbi:hypothetical protein GXP67_05765 [Rhodocytophaga rosea]|uniref:Uncharacterized protein n=1 Tax=Rhodocytophaga rosea TaxID=2704465 RepID=A0A6C0GE37_9BACT|nr:hypothetical protein [Rhodocytophaga rosea]QHT66208.1 hypothetical protein GXP67_05765 [Rhodocytophaga rosea]
MKFKELLLRSKSYLDKNPHYVANRYSLGVFWWGAKWMFDRLDELDKKKGHSFDSSVNFTAYGIFKYILCAGTLLLSAIFLFGVSPFLLPFSIIAFYIVEVHFLFLFPLLIDKVKYPLLISIKQTYRIGLFKAIFTIMPIGFFMVVGLFHWRKPLLNWHIGCLSVLLWYQDEVRARL